MEDEWIYQESEKDIPVPENTIRRLPRYFRYLRELVAQGKIRISSSELSKMMNVTASQIRSDLNQLGGFGHIGYGYDVNYLFQKISEILGVSESFTAVVVDSGDLGRALVQTTLFVKRGVDVLAMFDGIGDRVGTSINDIPILSLSKFEAFCETHHVDIIVMTCPKEQAQVISQRATDSGIKGIWNYTGRELHPEGHPDVIIENVHLGDSLMILDYKLRTQNKKAEQ